MSVAEAGPSLLERRIPTPIVIALASTMLSTGLALWLIPGHDAPDAPHLPALAISTRTAKDAAESFLDAWRKRRFEEALRISRGEAAEQSRKRLIAARALTPEQRSADGMWNRLAKERLKLRVLDDDDLTDGTRRLLTVAEGTFLEKPYRRQVLFILAFEHKQWVVDSMQLGAILDADAGATHDASTGEP
jgi:hypothetical protein